MSKQQRQRVSFEGPVASRTSSSTSKSSSNRLLSGKERENAKAIQDLRKENASLSKEISEIKLLHEQLLHENIRENASEKRVNILKSHIFQLERQTNLLSKVVNGYAGVHLELQNMLETLINQLDCDGPGSSKDEIIKLAKQIQGRLSKSNRGAAESNSLPLMFMRDFVRSSNTSTSSQDETFDSQCPVTILDVCSGKADHINMKKVVHLESKLAKLYGELIKIRSSLDVTPNSVPSLLQQTREHSQSHVVSSCDLIGECCHDLLCISLLLPEIPWPCAKRRIPPPELSSSEIMTRLSPAIKVKKEIREAVETTCNCFIYLYDMERLKCEALEEELNFHKSVYELQVEYVRSLFDSMRKGYEKFEDSVQELLCKPLKEILDSYNILSSTASDQALKELLKQLQANSTQLMCVIDALSSPSKGSDALSEFGRNFFHTLHELEKDCSRAQSKKKNSIVS